MTKLSFAILPALVLTGTALLAQNDPVIHVKVPFDFVAGNRSLPSGEYTVRTSSAQAAVWIRNADGPNLVLLASATENEKEIGRAALVFHQYGDRYFLSKVWTGDTIGRELPTSAVEKEYALAHRGSGPVLAEVVSIPGTR
jgi:hypothetical protein